MRNLNDIEAKAILLLNTIEAAIATGSDLPYEIILAASNVRSSIAEEDARLGADLTAMYKQYKYAKTGTDTGN